MTSEADLLRRIERLELTQEHMANIQERMVTVIEHIIIQLRNMNELSDKMYELANIRKWLTDYDILKISQRMEDNENAQEH